MRRYTQILTKPWMNFNLLFLFDLLVLLCIKWLKQVDDQTSKKKFTRLHGCRKLVPWGYLFERRFSNGQCLSCDLNNLLGVNCSAENTTSHHGLRGLGYRRATMVNTKRSKSNRKKRSGRKINRVRIAFWNSLALFKAESLVIVNNEITVKRYLSFAQTARHTLGIS